MNLNTGLTSGSGLNRGRRKGKGRQTKGRLIAKQLSILGAWPLAFILAGAIVPTQGQRKQKDRCAVRRRSERLQRRA